MDTNTDSDRFKIKISRTEKYAPPIILIAMVALTTLILILATGCGGGGGSSPTSPPPPPPPTPVVINQYTADFLEQGGDFTTEVDTVLEHNTSTNILVITTAEFGTISIPPSRTFNHSTHSYIVNFTTTQIVISRSGAPNHYAGWSLTLASSNG